MADKRRRSRRQDAGDRRPHVRVARPAARLRQGRTDWYRIANKTDDVAEIYIYDEIGYWGVTAKDFVDELREVTASRIELHINSPGGDVFDGIAIYNALQQHAAQVRTTVDALAASAASFIAMAGDEIVMTRNATMMIHEPFGLAVGDAADMRDMADRLDKMGDNIAGIYADRAGGSVEDWRAAMVAETWYDADEAVEAGLADEVTGKPADDDAQEAANSWDLSVFTYQGRQDAPRPAFPSAHRPAAAAARRGRGAPAADPSAPQPPAVPWDGEMAEMFRAVLAAHAEQAPAPPAVADPPAPQPPAPATEPFIDPIDFHNWIREATRAR